MLSALPVQRCPSFLHFRLTAATRCIFTQPPSRPPPPPEIPSMHVQADAVAAVAAAPQVVALPTRMNGTPHSRELRRFFYTDAADSVLRALAADESRVTMRCTIPELNPEMDVYRVGTLLELTREVATRLAEDGRRVKVCIQGSMGQGVFQGLPLSLSGAAPRTLHPHMYASHMHEPHAYHTGYQHEACGACRPHRPRTLAYRSPRMA